MKKLNGVLLSLLIGIGIVACGSGSSNSAPATPPVPNSNWTASGFNAWKISQNLINYSFSSYPLNGANNILYFVGSAEFSDESAIIQYDTINGVWSNITYNFPSDTNIISLYASDNQTYIYASDGIYQLTGKSWNLVTGIANGYTIDRVASVYSQVLFDYYPVSIGGVLAKDSNNNYKVYVLKNDKFIDNTPTPITISGLSYFSLSLFFDQNDNSNWVLSVAGDDGAGNNVFYYYNKDSNSLPLGNLSSSSYGFNPFTYLVSGKFFVANSAQYYNSSISYLCNGLKGCSVVNGLPTGSFADHSLYGSVIPPSFNKFTLNGGVLRELTSSVSYQTSESNGSITQYSCNISESGSEVTDCTVVGNVITPIYYESENAKNGLSIFNSFINNQPVSLEYGFGNNGGDVNNSFNGYGYYTLNTSSQMWQQVAPSFTNLLTPNNYSYQLFSLCNIDPDSSLLLYVNNNIYPNSTLLQAGTLNARSVNNALSPSSQYVSYNGSWVNMMAPGGSLSPIVGSLNMSGNSISIPSEGFYSILQASSGTLGELYINSYPQNCSVKFN